jgi:predicted transcriptional regulator of viral defense system
MERRPPRELGYRGQQVIALVRETIAVDGSAPSYAMIRDRLGFRDKVDVCRVVERLENRGLLSRVGSGRVRRIRLPS